MNNIKIDFKICEASLVNKPLEEFTEPKKEDLRKYKPLKFKKK